MNLTFITTKDILYKAAVDIRIDSFFLGMPNAVTLINDKYEKKAIHIVCLKDNNVLGTGRLHLEEKTAIISQMAIHKNYQKQGIGSSIFLALIERAKTFNISEIELSARKTALEFYEKYGFKTFGELYPSKKTGILHQKMLKTIRH